MNHQERTPRKKKKLYAELLPSPHLPQRRNRQRNGRQQPTQEKIVWKDSPAGKQMQSSGTGNKIELQQEIKGFLCRLTDSFDSVATENPKRKARSSSKSLPMRSHVRKSQSPIPNAKDSHTNISDNWIQILNQMEQKYDNTKDPKPILITPPKTKPKPKPKPNSPITDTWSPLTEESWKLLDQIENEATQRPNASTLDHLHAVVLETDSKPDDRQIRLGLYSPETEVSIDVVLAEDWYDTDIRVGDSLNLIFLQTNTGVDACYSTFPLTEDVLCSQSIYVNNRQHAVIVHPNVLVSPTSVTTTLDCVRRAWIRETWRMSASTNSNALLGIMKHELFQKALTCRRWDHSFLSDTAEEIVRQKCVAIESKLLICLIGCRCSTLQLIDCGLHEAEAIEQLQLASKEFQMWLETCFSTENGLRIEDTSSSPSRLVIDKVVATEEAIYSTKWGLKGALDATLLASFSAHEEKQIIPLELKTGAIKGYRIPPEHVGQVLLYTLLLKERYGDIAGTDGILMYSSGNTMRVRSVAAHIRGLLQARNRCANSNFRSSMRSVGLRSFPAMLQRPSDCKRCYQLDVCLLHHYVMESGDATSSGLDELFTAKMKHLSLEHIRYLRKWMQLLLLEERFVAKDSNAFGSCFLSDLEQSPLNSLTRVLRLKTLEMVSTTLTINDRVVISVESIDKKKRILHVARGRIMELENEMDRLNVNVEILQPVPTYILSGQSQVGAAFTWRIDLDTGMQAFSRAKENLIRLFLPGNSRECAIPMRTVRELESKEDAGDLRRRQLIDLIAPKFTLESFECMISSVSNRQRFVAEFQALNIDQRDVVTSVLNALDYALVLGMPGTGKTSVLAFIVRVLMARGMSVLITSYTHSAVDHLLEKIVQGFGCECISMLRIGGKTDVLSPILAPYFLKTTENTSELETKCIDTKLIGVTCLSIPHHVIFRKRRFDFCIVDEASQITEPIVLGALACADTFVLVGDPHQLPPLVKCPEARQRPNSLDVSLFERLSEAHPEAVRQLTIQYRMNDDIMRLVNHLVYENQLKCGTLEVAKKRVRLHWRWNGRRNEVPMLANMLENQQGVTWINTDPLGEEAYESKAQMNTTKMENHVEARVILSLVGILRAGGVRCEDIAIVSPFRAQVSKMEKLVRERGLPHMEVCTIDRYQGRDREIVCISFVRSNASGRVGELLSDWRRLNVALTRAKQKLVLVGSMKTLEHADGILPGLIGLIRQCGVQWEFPLTKSVWEEVLIAEAWSKGNDVEPEMEVSPMTGKEVRTQRMVPCGVSDDIEQLVPTSYLRHVR